MKACCRGHRTRALWSTGVTGGCAAWSGAGRAEWPGAGLRPAVHSGTRFKACELLVSGVFHCLTVLDHG